MLWKKVISNIHFHTNEKKSTNFIKTNIAGHISMIYEKGHAIANEK